MCDIWMIAKRHESSVKFFSHWNPFNTKHQLAFSFDCDLQSAKIPTRAFSKLITNFISAFQKVGNTEFSILDVLNAKAGVAAINRCTFIFPYSLSSADHRLCQHMAESTATCQ